MAAHDFSFVTCLATNSAGEVLVKTEKNWFSLAYNAKQSALQYLPWKPAKSSSVSSVDVYSPARGKMMATDILLKHISQNTIELYRSYSTQFQRWPEYRKDLLCFEFLGVYSRNRQQLPCTYTHELAELQEWNLKVNDYNQIALCWNNKLVGVQVFDRDMPRCVNNTASNTELVQIFQGRSQQFLARAVLKSLQRRNADTCLPKEKRAISQRKTVSFSSAECTDIIAENKLKKTSWPQLCDRNMRYDIADAPAWLALDLDRDAALEMLREHKCGAFVVFGTACKQVEAKACILAVKINQSKVQEKRIVIMQLRRNKRLYTFSEDLLSSSNIEWHKSLNSLLEPLYKLTQQKLEVPLHRMEFESC